MVDIAQSLTRKIGPFPAWGWGVGIGGGVLVAKMLGGGSLLSGRSSTTPETASDATQTEGVDTSTVTSQTGPAGPAGPSGPAGKDAPKAPARPTNNPPGWVPNYDPSTNRWVSTYVAPPSSAPSGKKWAWNATAATWYLVDAPSSPAGPKATIATAPKVIADRGAGGMAASFNSMPTLSLADIGGVTIASPDGTPRPTISTIRKNPIGMTPNIAGQRPRSLSRQVGRPFYGV